LVAQYIWGYNTRICNYVCSSNNDRVQHIDNEHQGKLYYLTPQDFQDRLVVNSIPVFYEELPVIMTIQIGALHLIQVIRPYSLVRIE
jgi:hypothetical protein